MSKALSIKTDLNMEFAQWDGLYDSNDNCAKFNTSRKQNKTNPKFMDFQIIYIAPQTPKMIFKTKISLVWVAE